MRFRKKPVEIEAVRYTLESCREIHDWMGLDHEPGNESCHAGIFIDTLEGPMTASVGDWIIRGVKGEFYPCKPDIFEATYEPVEAVMADQKPCPECGADRQLVVDLKTRIRNFNVAITRLGKAEEALGARVLSLREVVEGLAPLASAYLDGAEPGSMSEVSAAREALDLWDRIKDPFQTSDGGAGDREGRDQSGDTEGRGCSDPSPSVPPVEAVKPDRQDGEGPAGSSPAVPADLTDRAAKGLARGVWTSPFGGRLTPAEIARIVLIEIEPLLSRFGTSVQQIEREAEACGAAAERARWEARIEREIEERERMRDRYRAGTRIYAELNYRVILLRSLLTEEDNGE